MINKRLVGVVPGSKKYIAGNVILQWCSLVANIALMTSLALLLEALFRRSAGRTEITLTLIAAGASPLIRFFCTTGASRLSYLSSKEVKRTLREKIYEKLLRLGASYNEQVKTSEVVQVSVEGVDQLETYFGSYLPQFFYAMLAPLTLFCYLCFVSVPAAVVLLICVPLIPVSIAAVQTWAKKLLSKYWGQYTALGDTFLENLQGLTTLKIYQKKTNLADFLRSERGLDTVLTERGGNLSGGQRQRLALARALLHDSPVYIFDEATSNIDVESENDIMREIHALAETKTVILISHRLANVTDADNIYVLDEGRVKESGGHGQLLQKGGQYAALWNAQQALENYGKDGAAK